MKKRVRYRMGIRVKVVLFICLTAFILIAVGVGLGYFWGYNLLRDIVGEEHLEMAKMLAVSISEMLDREIETIETFSDSPLWKKAIRESNLKYETMDKEAIQRYLLEMDKRWIKASDDEPLIKEYIENKLEARLKVLAEGKEDIGEIFITDRVGGLVATSGRTTDFYQADEEWWQKAFADGKGKVFIGKPVFDKSANILSILFAIPIKDRRSGKVIGICKAVVECKSFFAPLEDFKIGETGHAVLVDKKTNVIFHYGIEPLTMKFFRDEDYQRSLKSKREWLIVDNPHIHKEKMFVTYADIKHPLLLESGIAWKVYVDQDAKEVFAPVNTLLQQAGILTPILIVLLIPLAFIFGGMFVRPLRELHEGAERIGRGDLDYRVEVGTGDEIEVLANSFNKMSEDLKKTTTSINNLNEEIAERKEAEERLRVSEQKFRDLTEATTDWIWEVDKDGVYTYVSPKVKDLLGYELNEVLGKTPFDLMSREEAERVGKIFKEKVNNKEPFYKLENVNHHKDGHLVVLETNGIPIFDEKGQLKGYRGIDRDITERKRAQETLRFSKYLRSAREEERKIIAREIHDELGQALTALKMDLSWLERKLPPDQEYLTTKTKTMSHITDQTIKTMKRIITKLRPTLLDDFGLLAALESMAGDWQKRTAIQCELKVDLESTVIDKDLSIDIFRIVQEALTNVSRHAQATKVTLSLLKQPENILLLKVKDNGKGIGKVDNSKIQSFGLLGIRERAEFWNGTFSINGSPGKGTVLTVQIPIP